MQNVIYFLCSNAVESIRISYRYLVHARVNNMHYSNRGVCAIGLFHSNVRYLGAELKKNAFAAGCNQFYCEYPNCHEHTYEYKSSEKVQCKILHLSKTQFYRGPVLGEEME